MKLHDCTPLDSLEAHELSAAAKPDRTTLLLHVGDAEPEVWRAIRLACYLGVSSTVLPLSKVADLTRAVALLHALGFHPDVRGDNTVYINWELPF